MTEYLTGPTLASDKFLEREDAAAFRGDRMPNCRRELVLAALAMLAMALVGCANAPEARTTPRSTELPKERHAEDQVPEEDQIVGDATDEHKRGRKRHLEEIREVLESSGLLSAPIRIILRVDDKRTTYFEPRANKHTDVVSERIEVSVFGEGRVPLAHRHWGPYFPERLQAGFDETDTSINSADLVEDVCHALHCSPTQLKLSLVRVAVRSKYWRDAVYKLQSEERCPHGDPPNALHSVVCIGDTEMVGLLLANGADPNSRDRDGRTPLHEAVGQPTGYEIAELLVANGANVNAMGPDGSTPLHSVASNRSGGPAATLLLSHGAEVDARNVLGETPLHRAALRINLGVAEILAAHHANINAKTLRGITPMQLVTQSKPIGERDIDLKSGFMEWLANQGAHP